MKYAVYYNKRVSNDEPSPLAWVVCPWDPDKRQPQIGAFRFVEIKTESLLVVTKPESKWARGVLVVEGLLHDCGDGMAYIIEDPADEVDPSQWETDDAQA